MSGMYACFSLVRISSLVSVVLCWSLMISGFCGHGVLVVRVQGLLRSFSYIFIGVCDDCV